MSAPGLPRIAPRRAAQAIWETALAAADVRPLVHHAVRRLDEHRFQIGVDRIEIGAGGRALAIGCGKASAAMAAALEEVVGDRLEGGLVVVKDGCGASTRRVRIIEAGHPVPDARGEAAARAILEHVQDLREADLVFMLLSGGGSALTPAPAPPVTLDEKRAVTRLLLAAGANITELNAVRKHLSLMKGGQLARRAAPARVVTLVLSDVIGDPLDVIGSGPTAPDPSTFDAAIDVLRRRGIWETVAASVRVRLDAGRRGQVEETPKPGDPVFARVTHHVIGNNTLVTDAAVARAAALGYRPVLLTRALEGEARNVAREMVARARALPAPACLVAGGETTVTVRGEGLGGRCQEFALAAALAVEGGDNMTVLAAGTDGSDGPTDAAGGLVDAGTVDRARSAGLDARAALANNDAHRALASSGDLVVSGPTRTNLLDLYLVLHGGCSADERTALTS